MCVFVSCMSVCLVLYACVVCLRKKKIYTCYMSSTHVIICIVSSMHTHTHVRCSLTGVGITEKVRQPKEEPPPEPVCVFLTDGCLPFVARECRVAMMTVAADVRVQMHTN